MANRAKRRDRSQRVGRLGEIIFDGWATENGLIANKQDEDYGIDFVCHEAARIGVRTEEVTGRSVHCQVRATTGGDVPRVGVDRVDVETALRQDAPYCLVGIEMKSKRVFFRFLDQALATQWHEFLASTAGSTSVRLDEMESDPVRFIDKLREVSRPAFRMRLARTKVQNAVALALPGARLHMNHGEAGDWALVAAPRFGSIWQTRNQQEREEVARSVFSPSPADQAFVDAGRRFGLKPAFAHLADLTDGPVFLASPVERDVTLVATGPSGTVAVGARLRHFEDERAYIFSSGLVIRISEPRRTGARRRHHHALSWDLVAKDAQSLGESGDVEFLKVLAEDASFNEEGRPGIPVKRFGLERIGPAVRAIEGVCSRLDIPLTDINLADLSDRVFGVNLGVLEALLLRGVKSPPVPGFVFGIPTGEALGEQAWKNCSYRIPVVMKFKQRTVTAWLTGKGQAYAPGGVVHGFRFNEVAGVTVEIASYASVGDGIASVCPVADWPPIPVTMDSASMDVRSDGRLPVEGEFSIGREEE